MNEIAGEQNAVNGESEIGRDESDPWQKWALGSSEFPIKAS